MNHMKIIRNILVLFAFIAFATSCSEDEFGKTSDIELPIPEITSISENVAVGSNITIKGKNFKAPNSVMLGDIPLKIVSENESEVVVIAPRVFSKDYITIRNVHYRVAESASQITPIYPKPEDVKVKWPERIPRGSRLAIAGENIDMVTEVTLLGDKYIIDGNVNKPDTIWFNVSGEIEEAEGVLTLKTRFNTTFESPVLPITDFEGEFLIADFEDGDMHFIAPGNMDALQMTAQMNRAGITAPQGENFLSAYYDNAGFWDFTGSFKVDFAKPVNMSVFKDPHINFYYNSADGVAAFYIAVISQNGNNRACGPTGHPLDLGGMWHPTNNQWELISIPMTPANFKENWGGNSDPFDPSGVIVAIEFLCKPLEATWWNGTEAVIGGPEVNRKGRLNLDKICITDGPMQ